MTPDTKQIRTTCHIYPWPRGRGHHEKPHSSCTWGQDRVKNQSLWEAGFVVLTVLVPPWFPEKDVIGLFEYFVGWQRNETEYSEISMNCIWFLSYVGLFG